MFLLSSQGHVEVESYPPLPEDPTSSNAQMDIDPEEYEQTLPSATSPDDQGGDGDSSSDNEVENSVSSERIKEIRAKGGADVDVGELLPIVEGTGDSTSAAPSSSKHVAAPMA